jgi:hypothetical protein
MLKTACATIALLALVQSWANPALAAGSCATSADIAALKTAVINQELMVAAFQCHKASAYNRFITTYKSELRSSDAVLKAYFVRSKHGEAGYDTFKTKAANLSALEQARNSAAFCADAHALFTAAFAHQGSLMSFVESRTADIGNVCVEPRATAPVLAKVEARPQKPAQVADIGVPAHSVPALPYRRDAVPAVPVAEDVQDDELAYADEYLPPPPRPRFHDIRSRDYRGYAPRGYGPPPHWREPPRYGWYPRDAYGR